MENIMGNYPTATYIFGLVGLIVVSLTTVATRVEKLGGVLGSLGRKIRGARRAAIEADRDLLTSRVAAIEAAAEETAAWYAQRLKIAENRQDLCEKQLEEMAKNVNEQAEYIHYAMEWVRNLHLWAAVSGVKLPPPKFLFMPEWKEEQKERGTDQ